MQKYFGPHLILNIEAKSKYKQMKTWCRRQENVEKANKCLDDGLLLQANEIITDIEVAQDAVLLEMKEYKNTKEQDQVYYEDYFKSFHSVLERFQEELGIAQKISLN